MSGRVHSLKLGTRTFKVHSDTSSAHPSRRGYGSPRGKNSASGPCAPRPLRGPAPGWGRRPDSRPAPRAGKLAKGNWCYSQDWHSQKCKAAVQTNYSTVSASALRDQACAQDDDLIFADNVLRFNFDIGFIRGACLGIGIIREKAGVVSGDEILAFVGYQSGLGILIQPIK